MVGIKASNLSLGELSEPLKAVVQALQDQGLLLMISIIDDRGELIATPDLRRTLQTVLDELPGDDQAPQATRPHSWVRGRWPGLAFQRCSRLGCRLGRCRAEACSMCRLDR